MKPPTVFLGNMTNPEVEAYLRERGDLATVIVPVGSTEQHGPHAPLASDVLIPTEVARRIASVVKAVVAPAVNYGLSYPHAGFTGVVHVRISTFQALIEDLCTQLAGIGFRRVVFLNGHYDNTYAIAYACAAAGERMPTGARAFPVNYWDAMTPEEAEEFFDPSNGLHANKGETSAVMAINPALVDMDAANVEMPPFPEVTNPAAGPHGVLLLVSRVGLSRVALRHVGRRARVIGRVWRALPAGRQPGHRPPARRYRAHLPGNARPLNASRGRSYRAELHRRLTPCRRCPVPRPHPPIRRRSRLTDVARSGTACTEATVRRRVTRRRSTRSTGGHRRIRSRDRQGRRLRSLDGGMTAATWTHRLTERRQPLAGAHDALNLESGLSSTRSARWPAAMRPRSVMPSSARGLRLAAATAAGSGTPVATRLRSATSSDRTEPPGLMCRPE